MTDIIQSVALLVLVVFALYQTRINSNNRARLKDANERIDFYSKDNHRYATVRDIAAAEQDERMDYYTKGL